MFTEFVPEIPREEVLHKASEVGVGHSAKRPVPLQVGGTIVQSRNPNNYRELSAIGQVDSPPKAQWWCSWNHGPGHIAAIGGSHRGTTIE